MTQGTVTQPEESKALAPQAVHLFEVAGVPFVVRPQDVAFHMGIFWLLLRFVGFAYPHLPTPFRWLVGMMWYVMFVASDTAHSVGHILSARAANAPVNVISTALGLQVTVYYENKVKPVQHLGRAAGGPAISALLAAEAHLIYRVAKHIPILRTVVRTWRAANLIVLGVALIPSPSFDGSSLLKWAVAQITGEEALGEDAVQGAGFVISGGLVLAGLVMLLRRRILYGLGFIGAGFYAALDLSLLHGRIG
ncbi:MAG: hypothetical protein IAE83_01470 [Anaerolinea sp.]|nr:hypothetical protein [Anaerolinea sp.]